MKLITINVEDEEHTAIKLAATKAGLSIKDYLLKPAEPFVGVEPMLVPQAAKSVPITSDGKLCKHGKPPTFCKFAKPGKPCK